MRILMLSWEYPPRIVGGISRVVHDLAQALAMQGNEVRVVTCWDNGTPEMEKDKNVFVHRARSYDVNALNFIDWVFQLNFAFLEQSLRIINEIGAVDIIHAHDWIVTFASRVLKHTYTIPLVSTIHATESGRNRGIHNEIQKYINDVEWWLTYESWKVIVNSGYMKNEVKNIFGLPEDKIQVIPNGIDADRFKGYEKDWNFRRNYAMDTEKIIFFIGRLVNEKGAHVLIEAMPKILYHYNDAKLVISGKGPQLDYLREKARLMNLAHKVYFTGYISDEELCRLYKCADVAVFPSLYEPFGIVALEAMAANVPVVVSDAGGLGEIVEHNIDGMKSYAGSPNSLADSILEILKKPEKAVKMKNKAFEKIKNVYNWEVISRQTLELYEEVLAQRKTVKWENPPIIR